MELEQMVKETFNKVYDEDYKLITIENDDRQQNYAIVEKNEGIIVDFWVSENKVFQASSKDGLLTLEYEIKLWFAFLTTLESKLKEERLWLSK